MAAEADRQGVRLLTFTLEAEVRFAEPGDVHRFTDELAEAVSRVAARYDTAAAAGPYRLTAAGPSHPTQGARQMTEERFTVEVTISAPVGEVWRALRDPEQIRRWHGWHFDGLDKEIDFIYAEHVTESPQEHWMEVQGGDRFELTDSRRGPHPPAHDPRPAQWRHRVGRLLRRRQRGLGHLHPPAQVRPGAPPRRRPAHRLPLGPRHHPTAGRRRPRRARGPRPPGTPYEHAAPPPASRSRARSGSAPTTSSASPWTAGATVSSWSPTPRRSRSTPRASP
ncbi:hypothetical protein ACFSTC_60850 [Nonomuraea ferruginea]